MKKAYLHIGVEKTGTTTIQSFMAKNRDVLRLDGFLYPLAPGQENHVGLTLLTADNLTHMSGLLPLVGLAADADVSEYAKKMLLAFEDEARQSACHTLVLSNEHLSSRLRAGKPIIALRDTLLRIADVVEVIVYLRRQDEVVLSEYSTRVKAGFTDPFALQRTHLIKYNYAALLDRWAAVFGRDHISIRLFEKEAFEGGDLIADFLHVIHYPGNPSLSRVPPQNVSLDVTCLEYLRRLNRHLPAHVDKRRNKARGNIVAKLTAISTGEKPRISSEEAHAILKQYEESNRDVAIRYLNRQNGQLFATSQQHAVTSNLVALDEDTAFKVSAALWCRMRPDR
jgi:hypothetical protein